MLIQCPDCHRRYQLQPDPSPDQTSIACLHCQQAIPLPGGVSYRAASVRTESLETLTSPEGEAAYQQSTELPKAQRSTRAHEPTAEAEDVSEEPASAEELAELRSLLGVPLPPGKDTTNGEFVMPPQPPSLEDQPLDAAADAPIEEPALPASTSLPNEPESLGFFERVLNDSPPEPLETGTKADLSGLLKEDETLPTEPPALNPMTEAVAAPPPPQKSAAVRAAEAAGSRNKTATPAVESPLEEERVPWGRLTLMSTVASLGVLLILWTGGYLHMVDSPLLSRLIGVQSHQFEFVGPLKVEKLRNRFSRQAIYVMTGTVRSNFADSANLSSIRLKGLAFDENQKMLESEIVYAGVVLSRQELTERSVSSIQEEYKARYGRNEINRDLREGEELPFQVVFFEAGELFKKASAQIISYVRDGQVVYVRASSE
jgi:hypothetical protein